MTDETKLPPTVTDALDEIAQLIAGRHDEDDPLELIRGHLAQIRAERDQLRKDLRHLLAEYRERRAERDALQQRINKAPKRLAYRGNDSHSAVLHEGLPLSWEGRRVALVTL